MTEFARYFVVLTRYNTVLQRDHTKPAAHTE